MNQKTCESCGMPMTEKNHFGGGDENNKYCCFCTYENGTLMSFEDKLNHMSNFIASRMGVDKDKSIQIAKENMKKFPVWEKYLT